MGRAWLLLAVVLLLGLLAGCGGGALPPARDLIREVRASFEEIDLLGSPEEVKGKLQQLSVERDRKAQSQKPEDQADAVKANLLIGYCWERLGELRDAEREYGAVAYPSRRGVGCGAQPGREYEAFALFRIIQVTGYLAEQAESQARDSNLTGEQREDAAQTLKLQRSLELRALQQFYNSPVGREMLLRVPPVASAKLQAWETPDLRHETYRRLDPLYRGKLSYQVLAYLSRVSGAGAQAPGQPKKSYPYLLVIVEIAILAKLITHPLTAAQFKSMRAMQAMQPELKKLQEKYKDDKQQLARAQMELFKEHKINPASSCLPMLIQFPILIWVYYAVRYYVFQFEGVRFLYIRSMANPDVVTVGGVTVPGPLLLLYGVSMYFSQKMLAQPAATPEQQQQQKLMSYLMPVFLLFVLQGLPAAFILYWFLQNLLMTGHQYLMLRPQRAAAAAASAAAQSPLGPPPEAIRKLSQGGQRTRKKKRRR
jgi:YidC/Oxa1 family membrane protein insertase